MLHVLIGNQSDVDPMFDALEGNVVTPWVVPKDARPEDSVLIFFRHTNSIVGIGEVVSIPEPALFGKRHVHRANITIGRALAPPGITLDELSHLIPEWAWLRYPRTYTTPTDDIAERLGAFISERIESDVEEEIPENATIQTTPDIGKNNWQFQEELSVDTPLFEGARVVVQVSAFERNPIARQKCIAQYGTSCSVCGFNFGTTYGSSAEGYIHVHHLKSLASIGGEYVIDPIKDLRPVCANCHAVIHLRQPPYSIEEIKTMLHGEANA